MSTVQRVRRCFHCGEVLQTSAPKAPGYISSSTIEKNKPDALLYCNKCYEKIKAINYSAIEDNIDNDIIQILKDAVATDARIVWVVDLFDFCGYLNPDIVKKIKKLPLAVIGTKRDMFSRSIKDSSFINFINERFNEFGLNPEFTILIDHEKNADASELLTKLNVFRAGHDVYMIGTSHSGKTSIINKLMKSYENKSKWTISSELYPGTNANVLEIPLSNSSFLYELPSLNFGNSCVVVAKDCLKYLQVKKRVEVRLRSLSKNESIVCGNFVTFTLMKGKLTNVKLYSSEFVEIKKIRYERIKEFFHKNMETHFLRPCSDLLGSFVDYDVYDIEVDNDGKLHDISIQGFGWFSFIGKGQTFRVSVPKYTNVSEHLSKVR